VKKEFASRVSGPLLNELVKIVEGDALPVDVELWWTSYRCRYSPLEWRCGVPRPRIGNGPAVRQCRRAPVPQ
jgi:hypothetical protein